jgi:hypothetical protein
MKKHLFIALMVMSLLLGKGHILAAADGCCVKTPCACVKGGCCVDKKCMCEAGCCAKGNCNCRGGKCATKCNCRMI